MGTLMSGVIHPSMYVLERLDLAYPIIARFSARFRARIAAKNPFGSYVPTEHDVFVATYVKSGTNWMMQIAHQLAFHGQGEYEHIHTVVPWPDIADARPLKRYTIPVDDPSVWMASPEQKRVIKTHFSWPMVPYSRDARYISVIRDPKDVFVSSYHFFVKNGPMGESLSRDTLFDLFLSEHYLMWDSWAVNTASYWAERHRPNVLVLSFKSMKQDLEGTVRRVAEFLDIRASDDVIDRVCRKASFEYMKSIDEKFRVWRMIPWGPVNTMMRKGLQGGSSELLSLEEQRQIDAHCRAELERLGSDFPYAQFCDTAPA